MDILYANLQPLRLAARGFLTSRKVSKCAFDMPMSKVPLLCFCHSRVCGIFVLLILLFFGIKFGETTQKVIALVATTFKALLSVTKTNGRLSGHKLYTGNICYPFLNILAHISPYQHIKKCGYRSKPHQKRKLR